MPVNSNRFIFIKLLKKLVLAFLISIRFQGKDYKYKVTYGRRTIAYQYFHLQARNKEVIIQTNMPLRKLHNSRDRPDFEIAEGQRVSNPFFFRLICNAIWEAVKGKY